MKQDRRTFVRIGAMGGAGVLAPVGHAAAEWTLAEEANVQVVNEFCAAWETGDVSKITSYMAENVLFRNSATPTMKGREASFERITGVFARFPAIVFEVVETFAKGPLVMNERNDWLEQPGAPRRLAHVVGVFVVEDGKIAEWTDYAMP